MVIWVTGMSCVGKTTVCQALYRQMKPSLPHVVLLDGDAVRALWNHALGYREADRRTQVQRVQRMARYLSEQGLIVLVAVLYSHPDLLAWNRRQIHAYFEIYLEACVETLRQRDVNGLYAKAFSGQMPHVVGVDIPWHAPTAPDMVFDMDHPPLPQRMAQQIIARLPALAEAVAVR